MEKMENSHDSSVIYDEVSRCVIYFSDGEKKVIVNQQTDSLLAVKVVSYPNESSSFTELVYKNTSSRTLWRSWLKCADIIQ